MPAEIPTRSHRRATTWRATAPGSRGLECDTTNTCGLTIFVGNDPGFAKLAATEEALRLARLVARRAAAHARSEEMTDLEFEHLAFNEALYLPSFGDYVGPGVVKRTLNPDFNETFEFEVRGRA